jgi:hypothetical protein
MAFRLRKRIRLLPGIWLNVGKTGVSTSIGGKGVTVNIGKHGARTTVGVPGTGLSYTSRGVSTESPPQPSVTRPGRNSRGAKVLALLLWVFLILTLCWVLR